MKLRGCEFNLCCNSAAATEKMRLWVLLSGNPRPVATKGDISFTAAQETFWSLARCWGWDLNIWANHVLTPSSSAYQHATRNSILLLILPKVFCGSKSLVIQKLAFYECLVISEEIFYVIILSQDAVGYQCPFHNWQYGHHRLKCNSIRESIPGSHL